MYQDALQVVISSTTWATTARWRSRWRRRSSGKWARNAARSMGIADSLIRVSVGIEDRDDLLRDFAQAFDAV